MCAHVSVGSLDVCFALCPRVFVCGCQQLCRPTEHVFMCAVFAHLQGVQELFNNPHLSDVTLLVEQRQIPAHRHVLATHSHMFDRMWNHSMKEVSHCSMLLLILSVCLSRVSPHFTICRVKSCA